jgi:hypothetical protein
MSEGRAGPPVPPQAADGDGATPLDRGTFLSRAAVAGGAVAAGAVAVVAAPSAASAPAPAGDVPVLNFLLLLEELQAAFYAAALEAGGLDGELGRFAAVARNHERRHVQLLRSLLGDRAREIPTFAFGERTGGDQFGPTAALLEETVIAGYNGQVARLTNPSLLAAMRISSVDARHAAWIRDVIGDAAAPLPADPGLGTREVTQTLRDEGLLPA